MVAKSCINKKKIKRCNMFLMYTIQVINNNKVWYLKQSRKSSAAFFYCFNFQYNITRFVC